MNVNSRGELIAAMNVLVRRRAATADPAEQATIDEAIDTLSGLVQDLNQASLLQSASIVAQASDELEKVVASARMGPFDTFLGDMQAVIGRLQNAQAAMHDEERLPPAPEPRRAVAPALESAPPAAAGEVRPINDKRFENLRDEYADLFERCRLLPQFGDNVGYYVSRLLKFRPAYEQLGAELGIPWAFIGIVHGMECGFNFQTHLHNGDPLTRRTVHVPKGRPPTGEPPFTWQESARDALMLEGLDEVTDWSVPRMLYLLEKYNGFGYRPRGVPSPYLWSFSNLYRAGKFVADGEFDPNAVSQQCGAALMLQALQQRGVA